MSGLRFTLNAELATFKKFIKLFPESEIRALSSIAKKGRQVLRKDFLNGQALNLKSGDVDKAGKHMISGRIGRRMTIVWRSYPVNLYERGRKWRSGKKEQGKYIITRKFKNVVQSRLQRWAVDSYNKHLSEQAGE